MEDITKYLDIKYALIKAFLFEAPSNILDISYSVENNKIIIKVILLEETYLKKKIINNIKSNLTDFEILIHQVHLSKEKFNENKGVWPPLNYEWLTYVLFSKAEVS